jgi:phosphoribosylpyrophosphate synthetase
LVVIDPHTAALESMCDAPVEMLTALPLLGALASTVATGTVVISADPGVVKLAEHSANSGDMSNRCSIFGRCSTPRNPLFSRCCCGRLVDVAPPWYWAQAG